MSKMVACANNDHSVSRSSGGIRRDNHDDDEDPSTLVAADPDTTAIGEDWPTAEGYTPLGDILSMGSVFAAMPPSSMDNDDDDDDEGVFQSFPAGSNAFVADPNALFAVPPDENNDEPTTIEAQQHDNAADQHGGHETSALTEGTNNDTDFRNLADGALLALENEYQATLAMPSLSAASAEPIVSQPPNPPNATNTESTESADSADQNFADFDSQPAAVTSTGTPAKKKLPPIDTAKIQKAMLGINATKGDKLQKWQDEQNKTSKATKQQRQQQQHSIIPATPLKAFRKNTPKAIAATSNLSRAATIAECLQRVSYLLQCQELLTIHVVGADHVECDRIPTLFAPLARWINGYLYAPKHLSICLVGPNVPTTAPTTPIDLLAANNSNETGRQRLLSARVTCHSASYHDWLQDNDETGNNRTSDLMVCFNAGIWGYEEWKPTIRCLIEKRFKAPFVVTSYTLEEAEDDFDVIEELVKERHQQRTDGDDDNKAQSSSCLWGPEVNPFASKKKRETATAIEGRDYRENHAWQAWRF